MKKIIVILVLLTTSLDLYASWSISRRVQVPVTTHESPNSFSTFAAVALSPDGAQLFTGSYGIIRVWDTKTLQEMGSALTWSEWGTSRSMKVSPDGKTLYVADNGGYVRAWDLTSRTLIKVIYSNTNTPINVLELSIDGEDLYIGDGDGEIRIYDTKSQSLQSDVYKLPPIKCKFVPVKACDYEQVNNIKITKDKKYFYVSSMAGQLIKWENGNLNPILDMTSKLLMNVESMSLSNDDKSLVMIGEKNKTSFSTHLLKYDTQTGALSIEATAGEFINASHNIFSADSSMAVMGTLWGEVFVMENGIFDKVYDYSIESPGYNENVQVPIFSNDGKEIFVISREMEIKVFSKN